MACGAGGSCPGGLTCGIEGLCRVEGTPGSCADIVGDAGVDEGDAREGGGDDATDAQPQAAITPSNVDVIGPLRVTGRDVVVPADAVFDTEQHCIPGSMLGDCTTVAPMQGPQICVCRADSIAIGSLQVRGTRALAVLAFRTLEVGGTLRVAPGAGQRPMPVTRGRDGGSYGTRGGWMADAPWGTPEIVPLVGGQRGRGDMSPGTGRGGAGGGAIQLTAGENLRVSGTIHVPGGGGTGACSVVSDLSATGGGSGGAILLEAPAVAVHGQLSANGGGGSGGPMWIYPDSKWCGGNGADGGLDTAAQGGSNVRDCYNGFSYSAISGVGGLGSWNTGNGQDGGGTLYHGEDCNQAHSPAGGGGGGGGGRIRINTGAGGCDCPGRSVPPSTRGAVSMP